MAEVTYIVVINTSLGPVDANLLSDASFDLPPTAEVVLRSSQDSSVATQPGLDYH